MTRRLLVTVAAAAFGLAGAAPALASQPYHVNFKNFALDASDSTRDGTVIDNGSLRLASSGLSSLMYTDPFAYYAGDGATCTLWGRRADGRVVLAARDDGVGVADEDLGRLFERFFRSDRARASRGTGLGLAVVKHVTAAAGGTVEAHTPPGGGLEVRCLFPAAAP